MSDASGLPSTEWHVGVDIGGTFTDVVLANGRTGEALSLKVLTTPDDPLRALRNGVEAALRRVDASLGDVARFVHGTTLATNAVIERKGARTALLTTEGFRDVVETGRELRYELYSLDLVYPDPLIPRRLRIGVRERVDATGAVHRSLCEREVGDIVERLRADGVESVAICFLHSYRSPEHERRTEALVRERLPGVSTSCSHDLLPEIGEYPRCSTTVINAYVQPLMEDYLSRMEADLGGVGLAAPITIIASNGGSVDIRHAVRAPAALIESGPAAGITAAVEIAKAMGEHNVLAFDMGGTTAKLCLVWDLAPRWTSELEVGRAARFERGSGLPVALPSVDLIEIGAGGGSLARVDRGGSLVVGPDSAGSRPGPACYGLGGTEPAVTDANLILGYLDPAYFSGGSLALDLELARTAVGSLGARPDHPVEFVASEIFEIVTETMANAARVHVAEAGYDVRKTALMAFGGGGPIHAWRMAQLLGVERIIVPALPGVLSAYGCLVAPVRFDLMRTLVTALDDCDLTELGGVASALEDEARRRLAGVGVALDRARFTWSLDMKYLGQRHKIDVPVAAIPETRDEVHEAGLAFGRRYRALYGREIEGQPIEIITVRLAASGPSNRVPAARENARGDRRASPRTRPVWFARRCFDVPVLARDELATGTVLNGPLVIEEAGSTILVPPRGSGIVHAGGHLEITLVRERRGAEIAR